MTIEMRNFEPKDAKDVVSWASKSAKDLFYFSSGFSFPLSEKDFLSYCEKNFNSQSHVGFSFFANGLHIGHCELKAISEKHQHSTIAHVLISPNARGNGYGQQMLNQMLRYAFNDRGLNRVGLSVSTDNDPAIKTYLACKFQIEGIIRNVLKFEDGFFSLYQMSILKEEWN